MLPLNIVHVGNLLASIAILTVKWAVLRGPTVIDAGVDSVTAPLA